MLNTTGMTNGEAARALASGSMERFAKGEAHSQSDHPHTTAAAMRDMAQTFALVSIAESLERVAHHFDPPGD